MLSRGEPPKSVPKVTQAGKKSRLLNGPSMITKLWLKKKKKPTYSIGKH